MRAPEIAVFSTVFLLVIAGLWAAVGGRSGPDPAKWLLHQSGFFALVFLVATVAVASMRRVFSAPALLQWRRPIGLAAFALASMHVLVYVTVFQGLSFAAIRDDIVRRPYILVGLLAWLLLIPLVVTSTRDARRRLGSRWHALHRAVYVIVSLGVVHQAMAQKADLGETLVFVALCAVLAIEKIRSRYRLR